MDRAKLVTTKISPGSCSSDVTAAEEDGLGCGSSTSSRSFQPSGSPICHADLMHKAVERAPTAAAAPARTKLSSRAGSFTPLNRKAGEIVPVCLFYWCPNQELPCPPASYDPQLRAADAPSSSPPCPSYEPQQLPAFSPGQGSTFGASDAAVKKHQSTTVSMRNVPSLVSRDDLVRAIDGKGFEGLYNFVYLPVDHTTQVGRGYAFLNLLSEEIAYRFIDVFNGFDEWPINSRKVCSVTWAVRQGLNANIERFRNSPVMADHVPESFKPVLFVGKKMVPLPEPTCEMSRIWNEQ